MSSETPTPIAVVGLACRFPGAATSTSALWSLLEAGESTWSPIPADRMNMGSFYHPDGSRQGSIPVRGAHFMKDDIGAFDSAFFSISAEEAKAIDPQQRQLLETTVEALDNAGVDRETIRGSETGVWIGSFIKDYEQVSMRDPDCSPKYGATGNGTAIMSNRISYSLDLSGPSMTIDTGCSASLVCVHAAVESLRSGETNMAITGGSGLILTPSTMMPMASLNFLSPDGRCFTFDSRANGYGRGEGIGIVILKRLEDAVRDNDTIRAVIQATRVNQDGKTPGITLPNPEAQEKNMRLVYEKNGLDPLQTAFVECHGTGTQQGDKRELRAVSSVFCKGRPQSQPLYVGSIKTNIGHLEGAAGVAGLIKGILSVEKGVIPQHINYSSPNPEIDFGKLRVKVPLNNTPWPMEGPRRASVNSFGFGGTNAHVVLEDATHYANKLHAHHNASAPKGVQRARNHSLSTVIGGAAHPVCDPRSSPLRNKDTHLFVISAHDQQALMNTIQQLGTYVRETIHREESDFMGNLAYTLACRRTRMQWRVSLVARNPQELLVKLAEITPARCTRVSEEKESDIALVFGGQGGQWAGMARELLGFDIFFESITAASMFLSEELGSSFDLLRELQIIDASSRINDAEISQPAITAIQVALIDLLMMYSGLSPSSACGHSSGEIAAAYAAGAITREDAWTISYHRGQCMMPTQSAVKPMGGMIAVDLSAQDAQVYADAQGKNRVRVACMNSPNSTTLSGDRDAILNIQRRLENQGVFNRLLPVTTAYHSHHMEKCKPAYLEAISRLQPVFPARSVLPHPYSQNTHVTADHIGPNSTGPRLSLTTTPTVYSSVTGKEASWESFDAQYWAKNLISPVRFTEAMKSLITDPKNRSLDMIVEIGPHATLKRPTMETIQAIEGPKPQPDYFSLL